MEALLATFSALKGEQWPVGSWTVWIDNVTWDGHSEYLRFAVNTQPVGKWWTEIKGSRTELEGATTTQVLNAIKARVDPLAQEAQDGEAEILALADLAGTEL